ncbi:aconitate hydratase [compost metagenome]
MTFINEEDYDKINHFDEFVIQNVKEGLKSGVLEITNKTGDYSLKVNVELTPKEIEVIEAGGRLNYVKMSS